jgi:hypothetical protein
MVNGITRKEKGTDANGIRPFFRFAPPDKRQMPL